MRPRTHTARVRQALSRSVYWRLKKVGETWYEHAARTGDYSMVRSLQRAGVLPATQQTGE